LQDAARQVLPALAEQVLPAPSLLPGHMHHLITPVHERHMFAFCCFKQYEATAFKIRLGEGVSTEHKRQVGVPATRMK
jgi:hypothetical protein